MARRATVAFAAEATLHEMLSLRRQGWSFNRLGIKYDRDHTTIIYWCRKMNVFPEVKEKIIATNINKKTITIVQEILSPLIPAEKINEGKKSYREYLEEARRNKYGKMAIFAPKIKRDLDGRMAVV